VCIEKLKWSHSLPGTLREDHYVEVPAALLAFLPKSTKHFDNLDPFIF
jgi:hypothetical protein